MPKIETGRVITARDKLACAEREARMRERVYAHRVQCNQMREADAKREIAIMLAIADDYRALAEEERKKVELPF